MKKNTVLLVFSSSGIGGTERSLTRMALSSPTGVYQLATLDGEGPWCDWVRSQGHCPLVFGLRNGVRHSIFKLGAYVSLLRYVRSKGINVVYISGLRASFWLRLLLKSFLPSVALVHGIRTNPNSSLALDRIFRVVEQWLNGLVDLYITNSKVASVTLVERCGVPADKVKVIYNGPGKMPINILPLAKRPMNVLTVANLKSGKGYIEYLLAIEIVLKKVPDVHFTFIGKDEMKGKVQLAISERGLSEQVSYVGFQLDISYWMKTARLFVLPSVKEGSPTSVLEAMSYGVPVVGFNLDGMPELIRHGKDGLLVPATDINCLAMAIIKLLKETQLSKKMSASSLERCKKEFQLSTSVIKHLDAFKMFSVK